MSEPRCPACGAATRALKTWLFACGACGFELSNLKPGAGTGIEGLETLRKTNFRLLLDRLETIRGLKGLRGLEVGPADGWFMEAAAARGVTMTGLEPDTDLAEAARRKGLDVQTGFFPDDLARKGPYDLVVFNDVFEHLPEPGTAFRQAADLLAPGGLLVLNLPSSGGVLYRIAKILDALGFSSPLERLWQKDLSSPHLSLFNPANLMAMAAKSAELEALDVFALRTITREGLRERVGSTYAGPVGALLVAGLWLGSFVYCPPLFLSDIMAGIFRDSASRKVRITA